MSAIFQGTFPVTVQDSFYDDDRGVRHSSLKIVTNDQAVIPPAIGSAFSLDSTFQVTDSQVRIKEDGLAEILVTAMGASPISGNRTKVSFVPLSPKIFGLSGSGITVDTVSLKHSSAAGVAVRVDYLTTIDKMLEVSAYSETVMPTEINGTALPLQDKTPGVYNSTQTVPFGGQQLPIFRTNYKGFICKEIVTEQMGSALLVSLFFRESGIGQFLQILSPTQSSYTDAFSY